MSKISHNVLAKYLIWDSSHAAHGPPTRTFIQQLLTVLVGNTKLRRLQRNTHVRHHCQFKDMFLYLLSDSLFLTPGSTCTTCSIMTVSWFCSDPGSGPEKSLNLHKRAFVGLTTGKSLGVNLVSGVTALHPALPPSSPSGVAHKRRVFISSRI